jgi:hypothetical protein
MFEFGADLIEKITDDKKSIYTSQGILVIVLILGERKF